MRYFGRDGSMVTQLSMSIAIYITVKTVKQKCLLKVSSVMSLDHSARGKLFHATGPLTTKLLSGFLYGCHGYVNDSNSLLAA